MNTLQLFKSLICLLLVSSCSNSSNNTDSGGSRFTSVPTPDSKPAHPSSDSPAPLVRALLMRSMGLGRIPLSDKAERKLASLVLNARPVPEAIARTWGYASASLFLRSKDDPTVEYDWHGYRFVKDGFNLRNDSAL